ncbi:MAG TPA: NAD(P)H-dependent oxidoreductase [Methanoregula sp.]|nr:NAD(P)H-dependent oxidoreductase [Methanoregula sp.]
MKVSAILVHPHPGSFNHAIAETVIMALEENRYTVCLHDLYQERFDPVLPYDETCRKALLPPVIAQLPSRRNCFCASRLVGDASAILKDRIDRVLRPGVSYPFHKGDDGEGIPKKAP